MNKRPNLLIFMTDQQRGETILPGSSVRAFTPHLDRFRGRSATFRQTYCPSPHCCPSRATFFTGLYPSQHGVWNNVDVPNTLSAGLAPGVRLWSETLHQSGYELYFSGKWHLSATEGPAQRGWTTKATQYGEPNVYPDSPTSPDAATALAWSKYTDDPAMVPSPDRGEGEIIRPGYGTYTHYGTHPDYFDDQGVVADASRAIGDLAHGAEPWCVFAGTLGPHDPYFVPEEFLQLYPEESITLPANFTDELHDRPGLYRRTRARFAQLTEREHRAALRHYLAFCSYQDALFGRLLETVEHSGQADNTIILYCSDHGDYAGDHGLWTKGLPCFKGAYHVPLVIHDPRLEKSQGQEIDAMTSLADIAPTIAEWTGTAPPPHSPGRSLMPWLAGPAPDDWREEHYTQSNGNELYGIQRSVTTAAWKFVYNGFDFDEFYDLVHDPDETTNLINDPTVQKLADEGMRRIWKFARMTRDTAINPYVTVALARLGPGAAI